MLSESQQARLAAAPGCVLTLYAQLPQAACPDYHAGPRGGKGVRTGAAGLQRTAAKMWMQQALLDHIAMPEAMLQPAICTIHAALQASLDDIGVFGSMI